MSRNFYRPQRSWAKVISLHASVCPHGGVSAPNFRGGSDPNFRGGGLTQIFWGGGVCSKFLGGGVCSEFSEGGCLKLIFLFFFQFIFPQKNSSGMHTPPLRPRDGQCTAGTHPTGMHSCLYCILTLLPFVHGKLWDDDHIR